MTRLESGDIALHRDWVPLEEVIGSALTRLEARLQDRKIDVSIADDVPLLLVDPVLFEQVFVNLFENVDKYTPRGTRIDIRGRREGDLVMVEVMDRGPGLPPGGEARVFEKFFRGTHQGVQGAGLGLPICKGIVEAHGGTMRAENRPEGGAAFHIVLPSGGTPPTLTPPGGEA
jgi:two-component system sensor histidine kinase KdpD